MRTTQKKAKKTIPCDARLRGWLRTTGGKPVPVYCTRPKGHIGWHSDQRDGLPIEWNWEEFVFDPRIMDFSLWEWQLAGGKR